MPFVQAQIEQRGPVLSPPPLPPSLSSSASAPPSSGNKINPIVLIIIIILALVFFIAALLHLIVRLLLKKRSPSSLSSNRYPDISITDAYERQLQQLFNLHDSGLDQSLIDSLPVFQYREIMGTKEPFDCAVCLCEFAPTDKLRLLPLCSHAFHIDCIDTWLLSNSTCPLCRGSLFSPGFSVENPVFELEDGTEEDGSFRGDNRIEKRVFSVRLGKFRNINGDQIGGQRKEGETSSSNLDARRCFSMGSCQYILADSDLQVALCPSSRGGGIVGENWKGRGGQNGNSANYGELDRKRINIGGKNESFSVSKIWLWSRKDKFPNPSGTQMNISPVNVGSPLRIEQALCV